MEQEHEKRQIISIDLCLGLRRAALERVRRACCNSDAHTHKHSDGDTDAQPNANRGEASDRNANCDARLQQRSRIGSGIRFFNDGEGEPSCYGDGRGD